VIALIVLALGADVVAPHPPNEQYRDFTLTPPMWKEGGSAQFVLGTVPLAVIARMTRSAMLEVLGEDYIRTARAKGLPRFRVIAIHALRNALIPVVTVIGLQVGVLFTGAILTETIFSWPGVGKWLIEGINRRDYPVLQGGTLLIGAIVMIVNLLVDVTYGLINPRIRHTR